MPPWLKWGALAFLILAIAGHTLHPQPGASTFTPAFNMEAYKSRLLPGYGAPQVKDVKEGDGPGAACGQDVTIQLHRLPAHPGEMAPALAMQRTFRLGGKDQPQAFQDAILGMKPGGVRDISDPSQRAEVMLMKAEPPLPATSPDTLPLQALDAHLSGLGTVHCGDSVNAKITLWDADGKKLFETPQPLPVTLGDTPLPAGLTQGIIGMQKNASRVVILPPALQVPLHTDAKDLPLPALPGAQVVIAQVQLVP